MELIPMLICLNVLIIVLVAFFCGCAGDRHGDPAFYALGGASSTLNASLILWGGYVVAHFLMKYW